MAYIVRDNEIIPIPIQLGKRVKIGSGYITPLENHIANDQLWIQDVFTFNQIPWYAIRNRLEKFLVLASIYGAIVVMLTMVGRYFLGAPG
jgi:hypothetical protein